MMYQKEKGFTLTEIIVVLAIVAILVAVTIPHFIRYIERAEQSKAIVECRFAVISAQALILENYSNKDAVTVAAIKERANVDGIISGVEVEQDDLVHLTYTTSPWVVTYCKKWHTCSSHAETYNVSKENEGSETDPTAEPSDDPGESEATAYHFYIANDANYKVSTLGDIETYDFGEYGSIVHQGSVFYWQGNYYYTRNDQYLTNSSNITNYINNYGVKIKISEFSSPGVLTAPGDIKLENGRAYVFFPYARYYNDYAEANYWFEVTIDGP